jgi:hypothetical protein
MPAEAPFYFAIAALSGTLAGLAGLVAGLRRDGALPGAGIFRLREIVEFSFANVLLALGTIPFLSVVGDGAATFRIAAVVVAAYVLIHGAILVRRAGQAAIPLTVGSRVTAVGIDAVAFVAVLWVLLSGQPTSYEVLLLVLLARPMLAFLIVLAGIEQA